ncbi:hypothetical protein [Rhizobium sp. 2YAF20]|uniref:hypothetical protein n=1 Tax=Rhizobium sp. 2YAF20 TaxID=3233027 RepID=UPI003F949033
MSQSDLGAGIGVSFQQVQRMILSNSSEPFMRQLTIATCGRRLDKAARFGLFRQ